MRVRIGPCILQVCIPPKFYGLPKIHKTGTPLRPIVSSRGSVTYGVAKVLSKVIQPLVGKSPHHIQSTSDFVSKAKGFILQLGECLSSYDVTSLFTSVPIDPALKVIKDLLEKDGKLNDRIVLLVQDIIELLGFCLHNTYFSFQNKYYEQVEGVPMGLPVSPIVANLYMDSFERKAIASAINPPGHGLGLWMTPGSSNNRAHKQGFLDHINSIDPAIKFTVEGNQANGAIPFLDTLVTPLADNSLSFQVYQKPTHTDQYLQWESHHSLSSKYSVIGTLTDRAKVVCTTQELLKDELKHLREALGKCKYPNWAISRVQNKVINSNWEDTRTSDNNNSSTNEEDSSSTDSNNPVNTSTNARTNKKSIGQIVIPYTKGTAESIKHICGKYGIQVHFKGNTTIKQILMKPKDPDPKDNKSGLIYSYRCPQLDCNDDYIGKTGRTLGERRKEHLKQPSPIHRHSQTMGNPRDDQNFNIIGREDWGQARNIKESIYIRVNNPTLNQNIGKYNLSHIWDRVLFNTPGLRIGFLLNIQWQNISVVSLGPS